MSIKYLTQRAAQAIDVELMSPAGGGFSFEQLVELAGFSVAQAITKEYSKESYPRIVVFSGPGNNGLDGLVAARHLSHFGYQPKVYYPKRPDKPVNQGLMKQCMELEIPFVDSPESGLRDSDLIVDAIFGFSFSGEVRQPFVSAIQALKDTNIPIVSVDIPSAWDVEKGNIRGEGFQPSMLVSLTAPKEGAKDFSGKCHYLGGRFISRKMEEKWGLHLPHFPGTDQCVRLSDKSDKDAKTDLTGHGPDDRRSRMDRHFMDNVVSQTFS
ncbi:MAG: YjeF N-terminal domain-containing protein [Linnemannia gamsii]|nr:MAG: YjeF N-terminal domain-containing protein [Linnemannia gamsii]